ncbi:DUF7847 domain-containing protein [Haloarcula halophila]|uniref:DUF7847 domain-containing protein n=1 Tax=Haloarcula TaxID=2237 RepID=UPI0023E476DB|nr:hypothetical protein [Halomicroarcula sp. DFY41]
MGAAIKALSDTGTLLRHNPVIVLLGALSMAVLAVVNFVLGLIPLVGTLVSLFVYPAFIAGLLSLIYAGRDGRADASDFTDGLGEHYLRMLGAYGLLAVPSVVLIVVAVAVTVTVGLTATEPGSAASASSATPMLLVFALVGLAVAVGYLGLQFFNVAIVSGAGVLESFSTSLSLAASAPLSTLGFTILKTGLGAVMLGLPLAVLVVTGAGLSELTAGSNPLAGGVLVLGLLAYWLVGIPLWRVVSNTYHVAYFNRRQFA